MLTFERVLAMFEDYLSKCDHLEVFLTKRGYVVLYWDEIMESFLPITECPEPQDLLDRLLGYYENDLVFELTRGKRELTDTETADVQRQVEIFIADAKRKFE